MEGGVGDGGGTGPTLRTGAGIEDPETFLKKRKIEASGFILRISTIPGG